jgi:hypothetical protein
VYAVVDATERSRQLGNASTLGFGFGIAAFVLCALGQPEPAAVLLGSADSQTGWAIGWWVESLDKMRTDLLETFGAHQLATLAARGAALGPADAIAYLYAHTDSLLQD